MTSSDEGKPRTNETGQPQEIIQTVSMPVEDFFAICTVVDYLYEDEQDDYLQKSRFEYEAWKEGDEVHEMDSCLLSHIFHQIDKAKRWTTRVMDGFPNEYRADFAYQDEDIEPCLAIRLEWYVEKLLRHLNGSRKTAG